VSTPGLFATAGSERSKPFIAANYAQRSQLSSAPLPWRWASTLANLSPVLLRPAVAPSPPYTAADGGPAAGMAMPGRIQSSPAPPRLYFFAERRRWLRRPRSATGLLIRCCRSCGRSCLPSPGIAGCRAAIDARLLASSNPALRCGREGGQRRIPDTFPYTWLQVVPGLRASCWRLFWQLFPTRLADSQRSCSRIIRSERSAVERPTQRLISAWEIDRRAQTSWRLGRKLRTGSEALGPGRRLSPRPNERPKTENYRELSLNSSAKDLRTGPGWMLR